jgi:hypothetical protein
MVSAIFPNLDVQMAKLDMVFHGIVRYLEISGQSAVSMEKPAEIGSHARLWLLFNH